MQRLLVEHLGIRRLRAVVGGSLGGQLALTWATQLPELVAGAIALATSPRLTSQAMAFDVVGRNAILRDPAYQDGQYYGNGPGPSVGLSIARMLGHITYLSREAMIEKFDAHRLQPRQMQTQFETRFSVGSYLAYQGDKFVERFDANSYLTLTMAIDLFDLGDSHDELRRSLGTSQCRWLLMSFSTDWLFPPFQSEKMVNALIAEGKPVSYCSVKSNCGHDAFLLADELPIYGETMRAFLANLDVRGDCRLPRRRHARRRSPGRPELPGPDEHFPSPPLGLRFDRRVDSARRERAGPGLRQRRPPGPAAPPRLPQDHGHRVGRKGDSGLRPPRAGRGAGRPRSRAFAPLPPGSSISSCSRRRCRR